MSDLEGQEAAGLLVNHAQDNDCNNAGLLRIIRDGTRRDPQAPQTDDDKKDLLPTEEKLRLVLGESDTVLNLLCCSCTLCCHNDERFRNLVRSTEVLQHHSKRQELAILILSGCLFALEDLCRHADFNVSTFAQATVGNTTPQLARQCFASIAPLPDQCSHHSVDENGSLRRVIDLCLRCRKHAFREAVFEKRKVVEIAKLRRDTEIRDRSSQNMPFIAERPLEELNRLRLTPRFYTSQIEPVYCDDNNLKGQDVFRKVYKYKHDLIQQIAQAKREAEIAIHLTRRDRDSFAEVLFAFEYRDMDYTYLEIVFPKYAEDLEQLFSRELPTTWSDQPASLLDNPLWDASLDVVNAASILHDAIEADEVNCQGHFDLKPANIMIKKSLDNTVMDNTVELLLIDFGQAAANIAGVSIYQPPEATYARDNLGFKYDVWSMGCLLLEVLIFLDSGPHGIQQFRARVRGNGETGSTFWQGTSQSDLVLRAAVTDQLRTLEDRGHPRVQTVVAKLRAMLSIFPEQRPMMRQCLGDLRRVNHRPEALRPSTQEWLNCGLESWKTSYSTAHLRRPNPGNLYFYRERLGQDVPERVTLDIESVMRDTQPSKDVSFVPLAFFDVTDTPGHTFACHFTNFHRGFTFHFSLLKDFLEFMGLLTYQRIMPDIAVDTAARGTQIGIMTCTIKKYGSVRDTTLKFTGGRLQIWKQLAEGEYSNRYNRPQIVSLATNGHAAIAGNSTRSSTTGTPIKLPANVWKMVLWTHNADSKARVCIVINIGEKKWRLENPSGRETQRLKIKPHFGHKEFSGAIFTPATPDEDGHDARERYPGFPIAPGRLAKELQVRLTEADVEFELPAHRDLVMDVFRKNRIT